MPIYELECTNCSEKVEKFFTCIFNFLSKEEYEKAKEKKEVLIKGAEYQRCKQCSGFMELIPSLTSMHPDNMWSGLRTDQGYVTSKKEYNKLTEESGKYVCSSISEFESINKSAEQKEKEKFEKIDLERKEKIAEHFRSIDIDNSGVYDTPSS